MSQRCCSRQRICTAASEWPQPGPEWGLSGGKQQALWFAACQINKNKNFFKKDCRAETTEGRWWLSSNSNSRSSSSSSINGPCLHVFHGDFCLVAESFFHYCQGGVVVLPPPPIPFLLLLWENVSCNQVASSHLPPTPCVSVVVRAAAFGDKEGAGKKWKGYRPRVPLLPRPTHGFDIGKQNFKTFFKKYSFGKARLLSNGKTFSIKCPFPLKNWTMAPSAPQRPSHFLWARRIRRGKK